MDHLAMRAWFDLQEWPADAAGWERQRKGRWAWRKFRRARRWARVLARVPGVRMIAIGNALGYGNCRDASDIDLVIVTAPRRIWTARLFVVAILKLFRQRPGEHTRDALCPSFFLTTDALQVEQLQLRHDAAVAKVPPDPYLLFWVTQLTVLYDRDGTYAKFWDANAAWVRRWLSDAAPRGTHPRLVVGRGIRGSARGWWNRLGDERERLVRAMQEPRLRRMFPDANTDTSTIIRDDMLKFHANDRRAAYRDRWMHAIGAL